MKKRKSFGEQIRRFEDIGKTEVSVEQKLDELIVLLGESDFDSETISKLQDKFNRAAENNKITNDKLKEFRKLGDKNLPRFARADSLENLLSTYKLDSKSSKRYLIAERTSKITLMIISVLMIGLGFAMIVMPAPPYFEMFTIYYFTRDDGVTLMDLISLLIVFTGVYLLLISIINLNRQK